MLNRKLIIWYNPKKDVFYYKIVEGFYQRYYVGYKNSYNHEVILIIPVEFKVKRPTLRKRLLMKVISFLEKKL